jgi:hypothetical protein
MFEMKPISKEKFKQLYPSIFTKNEEFVIRKLLDKFKSKLTEQFKKYEDKIEYEGEKYTISAYIKKIDCNQHSFYDLCMTLGWSENV